MSGRTDTERLDWLERNAWDVWRYSGGDCKFAIKGAVGDELATGDTIRSAIDAAMDAEDRG